MILPGDFIESRRAQAIRERTADVRLETRSLKQIAHPACCDCVALASCPLEFKRKIAEM